MTPSPRRPSSTMGSEQRKPLQFPLIPPLPPSNSYEKENQRQSGGLSNASTADAHKVKKTAHRANSPSHTPQSRHALSRQPLSANRLSPLDGSSPSHLLPRRYSQGSKRRVLRYGETVESLFLLTEQTSPEHLQLCQDIVEGPLADDASSWLRVVEAASEGMAKSPDIAEQGTDLIRLHRRATSRFSTLSEDDLHKDEENIFALWLSYARVQASYGSAEDARLTFRHIQNQHLGVSKASFYLKFAEFERQYDVARAIQVLRTGIEQKAMPLQDLHDAMKEIQSSQRASNAPGAEQEKIGRHYMSSAQIPKLPSASTLAQSKKRKPESDTSPKRVKTNDGTAKVTIPYSDVKRPEDQSIVKPLSSGLKGNNSVDGGQSQSAAISMQRSNEKVSFARDVADDSSQNEHCAKTPAHSQLTKGSVRPAFGSVQVLKSGQKKSSLLAKTPRLARVGLSGKPIRVNAEENPASDSDSSMDTSTQSETIDAKQLLENVADRMDATSTNPVPKITKMDLSYMLNWDPNARKTPQEVSKSDCDEKQAKSNVHQGASSGRGRQLSIERIEEAPSNGSSASVVTSTLTSMQANSAKTAHSNESQHSDRSDGSRDADHQSELEKKDSQLPATVEPTVTIDKTAALVARSNPDFLPLVSEDNILRVNNVPYAKLGVIGKGGSCKVYRALSKDCSILAIKKVKLGGMDRKAINGYANEIALLKRLRGNPSIIQMYDSEVDLSRKAIFVAMELGEVDLNQVIQQQTMCTAKEGAPGTRSKLDMNFIRLTWQQMLKAVHSIHEERIIHGDLKPANFLFVRGALKLIDFGIAKAIQSDDTTNIYRDSQIGTLNYMSPEAILDTGSGTNGVRMRIGRASDIWSLGCILYQMVYGRPPFAELHMIQKLQAIVNPNHKIVFPPDVEDEGAVDAMKLCLRRVADDRPPIIGENGLFNEHCFLHSRRRPHS